MAWERKAFCLWTNLFLSEIKTFWFQFHLLSCCWNEAAKSTDDVQQCPLWAEQNFIINRWKDLAQLSPWAPWNRRAFSFAHFLPSQITSGSVSEILLQRHISCCRPNRPLTGTTCIHTFVLSNNTTASVLLWAMWKSYGHIWTCVQEGGNQMATPYKQWSCEPDPYSIALL